MRPIFPPSPIEVSSATHSSMEGAEISAPRVRELAETVRPRLYLEGDIKIGAVSFYRQQHYDPFATPTESRESSISQELILRSLLARKGPLHVFAEGCTISFASRDALPHMEPFPRYEDLPALGSKALSHFFRGNVLERDLTPWESRALECYPAVFVMAMLRRDVLYHPAENASIHAAAVEEIEDNGHTVPENSRAQAAREQFLCQRLMEHFARRPSTEAIVVLGGNHALDPLVERSRLSRPVVLSLDCRCSEVLQSHSVRS